MSERTRPERFYPIGTPGEPWTEVERALWRREQVVRRSYADEVLARLDRLGPGLVVARYGALSVDPERYPLVAVRPAKPIVGAPWALITGGVHGYETSGVQGALAFLRERAAAYADRINLLVAPCVSPWAYEVIHRWNPDAVDPNRSFVPGGPAEESNALMRLVADHEAPFLLHIDLHETTDSDEAEFRPALAARDGASFEPGHIPDGFYTVGDAENPQAPLQAAIIAGVERVTHIAEADERGEIIGAKVVQRGVILYPFVALGLCAGVTGARFTSTTEVYPDSPRATPEGCDAAQVAAVCAALDHALASID
ncbi:MAG: M14 family metallocarboxypeptidase [Nannocystaceae bacterium]